MKNIYKVCLMLAVAVAAVGCYNDFDTPAPAKVYTDEDFAGMEYRTIAQVKQLFLDEFGTLEHTGDNTSWGDTKYLQIEDDIYIKGKVQSSDEEGNVYKSLYICDATGAIEIKLGTGNYLKYPVGHFDRETGTMPSTWVYVKLKGLYLGNYRMMLSIGGAPSSSYNKVGEHKFYANSNIENPTTIAKHVKVGEPTELSVEIDAREAKDFDSAIEMIVDDELSVGTLVKIKDEYYVITKEGLKDKNTDEVVVEPTLLLLESAYSDILVITADNMDDFFGPDNVDKLGRLVWIQGVTCEYGEVDGNIYPSWMDTNVRPVVSKYWYQWGFNEKVYPNAANLYGSVLFSFSGLPTQTGNAGIYVVRSSGYARFAGKPIVRNGATGDILGNLAIYAKYWANYATYQLSINRFEDLMFDAEDFITEEEMNADAYARNGYYLNGYNENGEYNVEFDAYYTPSSEDSFEESTGWGD